MIKYVTSDLQSFIQEIFHSQVDNYQIKILPVTLYDAGDSQHTQNIKIEDGIMKLPKNG